jgi:type I restriction enzyme, R subunit
VRIVPACTANEAKTQEQTEFLEFVLSNHIETGVDELDQENLPELLKLK